MIVSVPQLRVSCSFLTRVHYHMPQVASFVSPALLGFAGSVLGSLCVRYYYQSICQLQISCRETERNASLVKRCVALTAYRPTPFYLLDYHGHVHTVGISLIRQLLSRRLRVDRELLKLPDGGTVGLDWVLEGEPRGADLRPLVVLVHGLCGDTESVYIIHAARAFIKRGYSVVSFVSRGCGGLRLTTMEGFTAARYSDLEYALQYLQGLAPDRDVCAVGYSLGAGILLNYLGAVGAKSVLKAAVAVSPSWNFLVKTRVFELWSALPLIIGLKQYARTHLGHWKSGDCKMDLTAVMASRNVAEFDKHAVVPVHGFDSVDHYYRESSACRRSHNIYTPTMAISAEDDPVCSAAGCPSLQEEFGSGLVIVRTQVGGHVGFGNGFFPGVESWMDTAAVDWVTACLRENYT